MSKQRRAVTLEPEVDEYLSQEHINASGLVNDLVKRHMNGEDTEAAIREFRINQLEDEAEEYAGIAERKRERADKLREVAEEKKAERDKKVSEVVNDLAENDVPRDPDNEAIKTSAKKLDMTPEELLDELPDNNGGDLRSL
jgi:protein subunit release factor A